VASSEGVYHIHNFRFDKSILNSSYAANGVVSIIWNTYAAGACGNGAATNILMALDYANLSIGWNYLIKNGTMVSMVYGDRSILYCNCESKYPANTSCLAAMVAGNMCNITWSVNATGGINTTHVF